MRPARQSGAFIQAVIALLLAGGAAFWIYVEMNKSADANYLKNEVSSLRSYTAEAALLVEAADAGKLTANFFRVEDALLRQRLTATIKNLTEAHAKSDLQDRFALAGTLAAEVEAELRDLPAAWGNHEEMLRVKERLKSLSSQAAGVEQGLAP